MPNLTIVSRVAFYYRTFFISPTRESKILIVDITHFCTHMHFSLKTTHFIKDIAAYHVYVTL